MEDELRLSLLIAGSCFIIAVLAHGIWKIRKNNQAAPLKRKEPRAWRDDADEDESYEQDSTEEWQSTRSPYDDLGLGEVRVVSAADEAKSQHDNAKSNVKDAKPSDYDDKASSDIPTQYEEDESESEQADNSTASQRSASPDAQEEKLYGSVVSNPKPHMQNQKAESHEDRHHDFPEPPGFLIKDSKDEDDGSQESTAADAAEVDSFSLDTQSAEPSPDDGKHDSALGEQAKKLVSRKRTKSSAHRRRQEPSFGDDQMRIDFDETANKREKRAESESEPRQDQQGPPAEQEVLVLNVKAKQDEPISGAALLPLLLTLGFKFGDQDIFHRHVNSNGKGPVLFSLANMFKPGNFDIDNLETFTTKGISLFMILPIEGDPHQVFNMMHNAARKIADEFSAQLLDGRRSVLTKQGLQQYNEKIREFERQRMIARH